MRLPAHPAVSLRLMQVDCRKDDAVPELAIMGAKGDTKIIWDSDNEAEVDNAERTFNDLRAMGYLAFKVRADDAGKGEQIREFDPAAGKMILAPPMQGG